MPTYVSLFRFTEQGAKNIRDTQGRAAAFRETARGAGVTVREVYWLLGTYDGLVVIEAPDEETVTALMIGLDAMGNVHTQTMRAFDESEIGGVLERSASIGRPSGKTSARPSGANGGSRAAATATATRAGRNR
jgi:uncharacterized protein with GYD domain